MRSLFDDEPVVTGPSLADVLGITTAPTIDWTPDEIPSSLHGIDELAINFESNGLGVHDGAQAISVALCSLDGQFKKFLPWGFSGGNHPKEQVIAFLQRELRGKTLLGANTRIDVHFARTVGIDLEEQGNAVQDVQLWAALLDDNRRQVRLDALTKDFLHEDGPPRVDETRMATYHASEVATRAIYQVEAVARLRDEMWWDLEQQGLHRVRQLEDDCIYPVVEMEKNGAKIDVELMKQMHAECQRIHGTLMLEIADEAGFAFDVTASGWTRLFEKCGLTPGKSFKEDVIAAVDHPLIKKAHLAAQYASLDSKTFAAYEKLVDANGILHFDINQLRSDEGGTRSGRFSIGYVHQVPNAENHRAVFGDRLFPRELFIAEQGQDQKPGRVLEADAMQIEFRLLAHEANNRAMLEAYAKDPLMSFHKQMWAMLKTYKPDMLYSATKNFNFARQYGAKSIKLAVMMGFITEAVGEEIRQAKAWNDSRLSRIKEIESAYRRAMPEADYLLDYYEHLAKPDCDQYCRKDDRCHKEKVPHQGYIETLLGRRSRFPNGHKSYIGWNRRVQGSAADIMKLKLIELHKARKQTGLVMRLTIHDSVIGDATTDETVVKVKEILNRQSIELRVPILWDCNTGSTWAACK